MFKVLKGSLIVVKAENIVNLYTLKRIIEVMVAMTVFEKEEEYTCLWHQQLDHMSEKGLHILMNCKLFPNLKFLSLDFRKNCVYGKQCKQKFEIGSHNNKGVLDYIHSDI